MKESGHLAQAGNVFVDGARCDQATSRRQCALARCGSKRLESYAEFAADVRADLLEREAGITTGE